MELNNQLTEAPLHLALVDKDGNIVDGWAQQISQLFDSVIELQEIVKEEL